MSRFIDCHAHLCADEFDEDLEAVIKRAKEVGVEATLVVAENVRQFQKILDLSDRYPQFCLPCFGVHPVQGDSAGEPRSVNEQDIEEAIPLIEKYHERLIAIGEVGLDFTPRWCKTDDDKASQRLVLTRHVELAKKYDLPLNVHSRSAGRPTISLLKELGADKVLLHAFDGKASVAMEGVQAGFKFSIPPSIVRSQQKQKLVDRLPLEAIILETDAPALGPERECRNEPCNIKISCDYIAKAKKIDSESVANICWENTLKLFPKVKSFLRK